MLTQPQFKILRYLCDHPYTSQRALAKALTLSVGSVNTLLKGCRQMAVSYTHLLLHRLGVAAHPAGEAHQQEGAHHPRHRDAHGREEADPLGQLAGQGVKEHPPNGGRPAPRDVYKRQV